MSIMIAPKIIVGNKIQEYQNGKIKVLKYPDTFDIQANFDTKIKDDIQKIMEDWVKSLNIRTMIDDAFTGTFFITTESEYDKYFNQNEFYLTTVETQYNNNTRQEGVDVRKSYFAAVEPFRLSYSLSDLKQGYISTLSDKEPVIKFRKGNGNLIKYETQGVCSLKIRNSLRNPGNILSNAMDYNFGDIEKEIKVKRTVIEIRTGYNTLEKFVFNDPYFNYSSDFKNNTDNFINPAVKSKENLDDKYFFRYVRDYNTNPDLNSFNSNGNKAFRIDFKNKTANYENIYRIFEKYSNTIPAKYENYKVIEITNPKRLDEFMRIENQYSGTSNFRKEFCNFLGIDTNSILDKNYRKSTYMAGNTKKIYSLRVGYKEFIPQRSESLRIYEEEVAYIFEDKIREFKKDTVFKAPKNLNIFRSTNDFLQSLYNPFVNKYFLLNFVFNNLREPAEYKLCIDLNKDIKNKTVWAGIFNSYGDYKEKIGYEYDTIGRDLLKFNELYRAYEFGSVMEDLVSKELEINKLLKDKDYSSTRNEFKDIIRVDELYDGYVIDFNKFKGVKWVPVYR